MKPLTCVVIDDEPIARDIIRELITEDERLTLVGSYKNAKEALKGMSTHPAELLFLDISMPGLTGFQLLKSLPNPPAVIFTTAYREHALEGFDANAIDYLLKPIAVERFLLAANKAWKMLRTSSVTAETSDTPHSPYFFVKADGGLVKIAYDDVLYIESLKEYVKIVTRDKAIVTYHSLGGILLELPAKQFYRIHRSFVVNINAVTSIEGHSVHIQKHELPVSRTEKEAFIAFVAEGKIVAR
jgi:two-component system, LytTR family, response regulator